MNIPLKIITLVVEGADSTLRQSSRNTFNAACNHNKKNVLLLKIIIRSKIDSGWKSKV